MERKIFSDPLTETIIQCIIRVHRKLGPGFLKVIYRRSLLIELRKASLRAETEKEFRVFYVYDGQEVGLHRLDLLVEGQVIVELKTVEHLGKEHDAQVRAYLKATGLKKALLVNFSKERSDFRRIEA